MRCIRAGGSRKLAVARAGQICNAAQLGRNGRHQTLPLLLQLGSLVASHFAIKPNIGPSGLDYAAERLTLGELVLTEEKSPYPTCLMKSEFIGKLTAAQLKLGTMPADHISKPTLQTKSLVDNNVLAQAGEG